ncbi:MAG: hypothetical protein H0W21_01340 [Actinobacteria bacterium]|nr:hypothetical protein [Actinomycetota bacterium]
MTPVLQKTASSTGESAQVEGALDAKRVSGQLEALYPNSGKHSTPGCHILDAKYEPMILYSATSLQASLFRVARPVACVARLGLILQEPLQGVALDALLGRKEGVAGEGLDELRASLVRKAYRSWQRSPRSPLPQALMQEARECLASSVEPDGRAGHRSAS